jgi:hypothetical protein
VSRLDGIDLSGFSEPVSVADLANSRCSALPASPGVYVVVRKALSAPEFARESGAGWFKQRDPSYPLSTVRSNWVEGASIVYVGMTAAKRGLRGRVKQLIDFGMGQPVAHRGGRLLWHLRDWRDLKIAWLETSKPEASERESELISVFRSVHGVRPFANLAK